MRTLLLTALCAVAISSQAVEEKRDTVDKYIIDKKAVAHFDGSQLEGKRVQKYMIAYKENGNVVEKNHLIYTDGQASIVLSGAVTDNGIIVDNTVEALIVVDGTEVSPESFSKMNAEDIKSMTVLKEKAAVMLYGDKGRKGVILVETKAGKAKPLILVDGHECTPDVFVTIKQEDILNVVTYKAGSAPANTYKEKGRGGVIIITTKNGNGMKTLRARDKK